MNVLFRPSSKGIELIGHHEILIPLFARRRGSRGFPSRSRFCEPPERWENLMSADLIDLVHHLGQPRILVVGDVMLDRYVWGNAERISQEAPVILLKADRKEERLGGASSVATMLRALGAQVSLAGVVGSDGDAARVRQLLSDAGIDQQAVATDAARPTTVKERYMGRAQQKHPQQMIRVDYEDRSAIPEAVERELIREVARQLRQIDIVLISDYDKGVLHAAAAGERHRGSRPGRDSHARRSDSRQRLPQVPRLLRDDAQPPGSGLGDGANAGHTRRGSDRRGGNCANSWTWKRRLSRSTATAWRWPTPTAAAIASRRRPRHVYDITGAGDMVLSVMGLALASGADYDAAIRLANIAGGLEVEKIGVATGDPR